MTSPHHFKVRDLKDALLASGLSASVSEIEAIDKDIEALVKNRHARLQEMLQDVKRIGLFKFRPCHAKRLDVLEVDTDFWLQ